MNQQSVFAAGNTFGLYHAPCFQTSEIAQSVIKQLFGEEHEKNMFVANVETLADQYIHVIDIIKSGYGQYTYDLIDSIPTPSETCH